MTKILPLRPGYQLLAMSAISKIGRQANADLAYKSIEYDQHYALIMLCKDIQIACNYMITEKDVRLFSGKTETERCNNLFRRTWYILSPHEEVPSFSDEQYSEKLILMASRWHERFSGWLNQDQWCYETEPRIVQILEFLLRWHIQNMEISGHGNRGHKMWLIEHGHIPKDARTDFDWEKKKTIIIS